MPLIEVDEITEKAMRENGIKYTDKTAALQSAAEADRTVADLLKGPNRRKFWELYKEQYPDRPVPEIDAAKPVLEEAASTRKLLEDFIAAQKQKEEDREKGEREARANRTVEQGRRYLRSKEKLDDEGVKAVEQLMQDDGIPDYEAAFLKWQRQQPPKPVDLPASNLGRSLDWFKEEADQPDKGLLLKDPLAYRAKRSGQILSQLRAGLIDEFGRPTNRAA